MSGIFIAGTDTCVGKTVVTALLKRYLREQGKRCVTHKWVQSGADIDDDLSVHRQIGGIENGEEKFDCVSYRFKHPSSPHLAASLENKSIDKQKIIDDYNALKNNFDLVLAENSGGLLVPYNQSDTMADIALGLELPVVLVAGNKLGAINHTLLTIEYLRSKKINILGVIFSDLSADIDPVIGEDNLKIVEKISGVNIFGRLPYSEQIESLYGDFVKIISNIKDLI